CARTHTVAATSPYFEFW
nr:immunoglobulin heavy chain junction region [Macaca mulatta]MOX93384.1 immunoglobulin heavy chain junction region [Macaca mulatta]MOX93592.1 immunoglobulin heavy chain junction region [Macaca mulatta]MOX95639.1 immunoglobulin heavy chain junction region [Macaca mulatta]MOX96219.1 immunoglobulin heavy chain junction region [Macaca mulatta]